MKKPVYVALATFCLCLAACQTPSPVDAPSSTPSPSPSTPLPGASDLPEPSPESNSESNSEVTPETTPVPSTQPEAQVSPPETENASPDLSKVTSIAIDGKRYLNAEGESLQLTAMLKDANGNLLNSADFPLDWSSSRPQDLSVDQGGKVLALTDYGYTRVTLSVRGTDLTVQQLLSVNAPSSNIKIMPAAAATPTPVPVATLTNRSPIGGKAGNTVVLTGTNFSHATGVLFGNTPASAFVIDSDTQITATVPAGSGNVDIYVTTQTGSSMSNGSSQYAYTRDSYTYSWPATQSRTRTPGISSGTITTFSTYSTSFTWNYLNLPFTVPVTGNYNFTATSSPVVNTSWILNGRFSPSVTPSIDPVTPIANFMISNFSGGNTSTFNNVALVAGQQYTFLTAFNHNGSPADTVTVTVSGPDGVGFIPGS